MSEIKTSEMIKKLAFGLMICAFVYFAYIALVKTQKPAIQTSKELCLKDKENTHSGIVVKNTWSRGTFISELKNGQLHEWWCKSKVKDLIEAGDSIYKPSGTFDTYIFKQANLDSMILIECDFDCDYWEKRYGKKK